MTARLGSEYLSLVAWINGTLELTSVELHLAAPGKGAERRESERNKSGSS